MISLLVDLSVPAVLALQAILCKMRFAETQAMHRLSQQQYHADTGCWQGMLWMSMQQCSAVTFQVALSMLEVVD